MTKEKLLTAVMAAAKAIDDKFGMDIKILDISGISVLADYFLIATANNPNQTRAMCHEAEGALRDHGIPVIHSEGINDATWALMDFGAIVVHIFNKDQRDHYNLERLWGDAVPVEVTIPAPTR